MSQGIGCSHHGTPNTYPWAVVGEDHPGRQGTSGDLCVKHGRNRYWTVDKKKEGQSKVINVAPVRVHVVRSKLTQGGILLNGQVDGLQNGLQSELVDVAHSEDWNRPKSNEVERHHYTKHKREESLLSAILHHFRSISPEYSGTHMYGKRCRVLICVRTVGCVWTFERLERTTT